MINELSLFLIGTILGFIIMNFLLKFGTKYQINIILKEINKFINNLIKEENNGKEKK